MKCVIVFIWFSLFAAVSFADLPVAPYAKAAVAPNGRYIFLLVPDRTTSDPNVARGTMYEVANNGSLKERWHIDGWYSFNIYVADDGMHLVRIVNPVFGHKPSRIDIGLSFYNEGKLIKSYSTLELLGPKSKVPETISFYEWITPDHGVYAYISVGQFILTTADGVVHFFDLNTGNETKKGEQ